MSLKSIIQKLLCALQVIFEAERGRGTEGEIALDNVVLTSGSCQDDDAGLF